METRGANALLSTLIDTNMAKKNRNSSEPGQNNAKQQNTFATTESVAIGQKAPALNTARTKLLSDTTEQLDNGYRRIQEFERGDGKSFTRIEEFTVSEDRARRNVIQQNSSGSTTLLEDIYDRQDDGSFRFTQRYTNEIGETSVNIDPDAKPPSTDVILGRTPNTNSLSQVSPFRGTEFDVVT